MNDNEKAATFIGWKPGIRCEDWRHCYQEIPFEWECGYHGADTHHVAVCPDMNCPSNYSRALTALVLKYGAMQITLTRGAVGIATPGFGHHVIENTWAVALAKLYDSEQALALKKPDGSSAAN